MATKQKGLNGDNGNDEVELASTSDSKSTKQKTGKKQLKTLYLRIPANFWEDIQKIADMTGLSMNAVCMDLLRPAIKSKLKLLQEE